MIIIMLCTVLLMQPNSNLMNRTLLEVHHRSMEGEHSDTIETDIISRGVDMHGQLLLA